MSGDTAPHHKNKEKTMFSEPTITFVSHLFNAPGLNLELAGAGGLALGVVCYLARVCWIAMSVARRMDLESAQRTLLPHRNYDYSGPYCAG